MFCYEILNNETEKIKPKSIVINMDEIDKRILSFLFKDGRISLIDISNNLLRYGIKISTPSIKRRISQLVESGIIRKFGIILNYDQLDLASLAFINLKVEPSVILRVAKNISLLPEVQDVYIVQDDYNLLVNVRCKDYKEVSALIERFSSSRYVKDVKTCVVLDSYSKSNLASQILKEADILTVDIDRDGKEEIILDNPILSTIIKPHLGGRVSEIIFKETGNNQVKTDNGFLLDNFAEEGWGSLANLSYEYEVLEANKKLVTVKLSKLFNGSKLKNILLEKKITSYSNNSILRIDYKILNKSETDQKVTFWISNYVAVGGDIDEEDCFFLPIEGKMESEMYKRQSYHVMWPVENPEVLGEEASHYIKIEQPEIREQKISDGWAAWMDTRSEEIVSFFWNKKEVVYIKRCFLLNSYSFEIIFKTIELKPNQSKDYSFFVMIAKGGQDLVWQQNEKLSKEFK